MNFTVEELADVLLNDVLFPLREGIFETPYFQNNFINMNQNVYGVEGMYISLERLQTKFDQVFSTQYPKVADKFQVELVYSRFGQILFYISKKK